MYLLNISGEDAVNKNKWCKLKLIYKWLTFLALVFLVLTMYLLTVLSRVEEHDHHSHRHDILVTIDDQPNNIVEHEKSRNRETENIRFMEDANNITNDVFIQKNEPPNKSVSPKFDTAFVNSSELAELALFEQRTDTMFTFGALYKVRGEGNNEVISDAELVKRMNRIRESMAFTWSRYKKCAWGMDKLHPDSCRGSTWFGLGLTIIDSLDTLFLMGLRAELREARQFVKDINYRKGGKDVNIFELTIRVLGALLTMSTLTQDQLYLNKAVELGDLLIASGAFKTASGVPLSDIDLAKGLSHRPTCPGCSQHSSLSETTTIQLEFNELARLTGDKKYKDATDKVMFKILDRLPPDGLPRIYVDTNTGSTTGTITLGARGDSYYEYLLKQWIQTRNLRFKTEYTKAIQCIQNKLVFSSYRNLTYIAEIEKGNKPKHKMDHLVCFLPGSLALGTLYGMPSWHLTLAEQIIRTCVEMYNTRSGLAPEIIKFDQYDHKLFIFRNDEFSLLRPETVESLFLLWRVTHKQIYRHWAWDIYSSIERKAKHEEFGYSSLGNIDKEFPKRRDSLESFFIAETLKYLYLIHEPDDILPLDRYVFNTEAHPFPVSGDT